MEGVYKMKKITFLCIFVVGALFSSIVKAETVLFCQSELIVGFFNDGGSWRKGNFANERYTLSVYHQNNEKHCTDKRERKKVYFSAYE